MVRNAFVALVTALVLALGPGAALAAAAGGSPGAATTSKSKQKKKGKKNKKSCKGKKGKAKKKCLRNQSKKNKGSGKLANGRYEDPENGVTFKVTNGGKRIQLVGLELPSLCLAQEVANENSVPLKSRKGDLVAEQSFTIRGTQTTVSVDWSAEIDPDSLRFSLHYEASFELVAAEQAPVRCEDSGRYAGRLAH